MPSTYTLNNGIELIGTGEQSGTWGATTNTNFGLVDTALDGQVSVTLASAGNSGSPNNLPVSDGSASNGRNRMVMFTDGGDLGATAYVQLTPNDSEKIIYVRNSLSGSRSIILFQGTYNASNDYEVPAGTTAVVYFDGAGSGAVAANVFNNAYFDSLRLGGVSVTAILDEDNMASDSATALSTQQSIKAYVDAQVGSFDTLAEVLAQGNTTGGTDLAVSAGDDITFTDTSKAIFGAGSDLQIYHDGSNSYIEDTGVGTLNLKADIIYAGLGNQGYMDFYRSSYTPGTAGLRIGVGSANQHEIMTLSAIDLVLKRDTDEKLRLNSTGIDVTGTAVTDGLTVAGNVSVDGGTIKLDGNYPVGGDNVALGDTALDSVEATGKWNVAIGDQALTSNTTGDGNVGIGRQALTTQTTALNNTAIGFQAGYFTTTGGNNVAIGAESLEKNTTGTSNVAVGRQSLLSSTTADDNTAVGRFSGYNTTTGANNNVLGYEALYTNTTGNNNTAVGWKALRANTTASNNTAVGHQAGYTNTTGTNNVAIGRVALTLSTTGDNNTAVGSQALDANTTASNNVAVGYAALSANTTGTFNTALGTTALLKNTTANNNTAVGYQSLYDNTTGSANVALGTNALGNNTTGANNIAVGYQALLTNTEGADNVAVGQKALFSNTTASQNTVVGYQAAYAVTTGHSNTIIGRQAGRYFTTGVRNTLIGLNAGFGLATSSSDNVFVGQGAGSAITSGDANTILGTYSGNEGGLDIRTSSNNIVLSDGDGNPRVVVDSSGNVDIANGALTVNTLTDNEVIGEFVLWDSTQSSQPYVRLAHSLGTTVGSHTAITVSDALGRLTFAGSDGSAFYDGAAITADATQNFTGSAGGTRLEFQTTAEGTRTLATKMTLDSSGNLGIGTISPTGRTEIVDNGSVNDRLLYLNSSGGLAGGQTGPLYGLYADIQGNNSSTAAYGAYMNAIPASGAAYGVFAETTQGSSSKDSIAIYGSATVASGSTNHGSNRGIGSGPVAGVYATTSTTGTSMSAQTTALHALNASVYGSEAYGAWIETTAGPTTVVPMKVAHDGSELMRIDSSGHLIIPAGVTLGTGAGVYAAANTLDDYEEGTWTPTSTTGSVTYSSAKYIKCGNSVTLWMTALSFADITSSNDIIVNGLPFTSGVSASGSLIMSYMDTAGVDTAHVSPSATNLKFYVSSGSGAFTRVPHSAFNSTSNQTYFTVTYEAA